MQRLIRIVFSLVALIYLGGMVYQVGYLAYFKIYQDEIIAEHCVNKDKPELECNGHCHLKKELEKTDFTNIDDQSDNRSEPLPQIELDFLVAVFPEMKEDFIIVHDHIYELIWRHDIELCCTNSDPVWHPPRV